MPADVRPVAGSGSGDLAYTHVQGVPAATWTVTHNLGKRPTVAVVDSMDRLVIAEVEYLTDNVLEVKLAAAVGGKAYCN
jgi:hypothetical protein